MTAPSLSDCNQCGAAPGELHRVHGCDLERCAWCGGQLWTCGCPQAKVDTLPRVPWSGEYPGDSECREFGWMVGSEPDLMRLKGSGEARWDRKAARWVLKKGKLDDA